MSEKIYAPHQQRVIDEANELQDRLTKLGAFIQNSPIFESLDSAEQDRLKRQMLPMSEYLGILRERISAF